MTWCIRSTEYFLSRTPLNRHIRHQILPSYPPSRQNRGNPTLLIPNIGIQDQAREPQKYQSWILEMSAGGAFGGNRGARPVPPEKGVFPLDHLHECDLEKKEYIACLKSSGHQSEKCRSFSKKYLECRMERNLMAKQDMSELGFGKESEADPSEELNAKIDHRPSPPTGNKRIDA